MTNQEQLITPSTELRKLWAQQAQRLDPHDPIAWLDYVAIRAAQWGANTELEKCCEWAEQFNYDDECYQDKLRAARRPKPASLKEQALERLTNLEQGINPPGFNDYNTIRRALEQLND